MENISHAIIIAVSIIATCILIGIGVIAVGNVRDSFEAQNENVIKLKQEYLDDGLDKYNGVQITGAEVMNAVKQLYKKYTITVINSASDSLLVNSDGDITTLNTKTLANNKSNPMYVNPNGIYYSTLVEINSGKSLAINFTKKTGSAKDLGISDQESVAQLKTIFREKLSDFSTDIQDTGKALLNSKFTADMTYGYDSFTTAMDSLGNEHKWSSTSLTELSYMGIMSDLLTVLSDYIDAELLENDTPPENNDDNTGDDTPGDDEPEEDNTKKYKDVINKLTDSFIISSDGGIVSLEKYSGIDSSLSLGGFSETSQINYSDASGINKSKEFSTNWKYNAINSRAFENNNSLNEVCLVSDVTINDFAFAGASFSKIYLEEGYKMSTLVSYGNNAFSGIVTSAVDPTILYIHEGDVDSFVAAVKNIASLNFQSASSGSKIGTIDFYGLNNIDVYKYDSTINNVGNFTFTTTSDGKATITGYTGVLNGSDTLTIPSTLSYIDPDTGTAVQLSVVGIADNAFTGMGMGSVVFEGKVTGESLSIGRSAFKDCAYLTTVNLNDVTTIRKDAFNGCSSLVDVQFGKTAIPNTSTSTTIAESAFVNCNTDLIFSVYDNYAGQDTSVTSKAYDILSRYIRDNSNYSTYRINVLNSTSTIRVELTEGERLSVNGYNLIGLSDGTAAIESITDPITTLDDVTIEKDLIDGNKIYTITQIGSGVFQNNTIVKNVTLGDGIDYIGDNAFNDCTELLSVTGVSVKTVGDKAFARCTKMTSFDLGNNLISIGDSSFINCTSLTEIALPATLKTIGKSAFNGCSSVTKVTLGNNTSAITSIDSYAFANLSSLSEFNCYSTATVGDVTIANDTFYNSNACTVKLKYNVDGGAFHDYGHYPAGSSLSDL